MPLTAVGALIALLLAPGFLLVRGYERRRYRNQPERDVYAVAEAVVASAVWLAISWIVLTKVFGDPLRATGVFPFDEARVEGHSVQAVALALGVVVVPYGVGVGAALVANLLAGASRKPWTTVRAFGRRFGFFKIPNAWDRAWLQLERHRSGVVVLKLTDGSYVVGGFGTRSRIDVSPLSTRSVFLPTSHAHASPDYKGGVGLLLNIPDNRDELLADPGFHAVTEEVGVVVDGEQIAAVFFRKV